MATTLQKILLAKPRGFCAGVDRAIDTVNVALELYGAPVYVRKEIVHNRHVVEELRTRGAVFVEELAEVPDGATVVFSAHGIAPAVRQEAQARRLRVIDATCPLVTKVHVEAVRFAREGYSILLIGHEGHDEVIGTMGEAPAAIRLVGTIEEAERVEVPDPSRVAVITQTTLSVDDTRGILETLQRRFPRLALPPKDDICYATQNRQMAVKRIAKDVDLVLVVGATNSSNSLRLVEVARQIGTPAHLIDDVRAIQPAWLEGVQCVGLTSGASAPEHLVQQVVAYLQRHGVRFVEEWEAVPESVNFGLPPELAAAQRARRAAVVTPRTATTPVIRQ